MGTYKEVHQVITSVTNTVCKPHLVTYDKDVNLKKSLGLYLVQYWAIVNYTKK